MLLWVKGRALRRLIPLDALTVQDVRHRVPVTLKISDSLGRHGIFPRRIRLGCALEVVE